MKKRIIRMSIATLIGMTILVGLVLLLAATLSNNPSLETLYAGKPITFWQQQLNGHDAGASKQALAVVSAQIIPQLVEQMCHDTNDSTLRLSLIKTLNGLPGVQIYYTEAYGRRSAAAECLGEFGPVAKTAVPALIEALKGKDSALREPAIRALGRIHSDPDVVIPLLITFLDDDNLNDEAAIALGNFGSLAREAIPKIIPLLHAQDDDAQVAAREALTKIDPVAAAKAEDDLRRETSGNSSTNRPDAETKTGPK